MHETLLIFDFGSQYTQLIARRVRELNVFCEIHPYNKIPESLENVKGIILSGSPFSVFDTDAPFFNFEGIKGKLPMLAVCYGAQLIARDFKGKVMRSQIREYGRANLSFIDDNILFKGINLDSQVWMSHGDTVSMLPENSKKIASTSDVDIAGFKINDEPTYGLQFHPEVYHSIQGALLLHNFVVDICGFSQSWTPDSFVDTTVA